MRATTHRFDGTWAVVAYTLNLGQVGLGPLVVANWVYGHCWCRDRDTWNREQGKGREFSTEINGWVLTLGGRKSPQAGGCI